MGGTPLVPPTLSYDGENLFPRDLRTKFLSLSRVNDRIVVGRDTPVRIMIGIVWCAVVVRCTIVATIVVGIAPAVIAGIPPAATTDVETEAAAEAEEECL